MRKLIAIVLLGLLCSVPCSHSQQNQGHKKGHKQKYNVDAATQQKIDQIRQQEKAEIDNLKRIHDTEAGKAKQNAADDMANLPTYRRGRGHHHGRGKYAGTSAYGGTAAGRAKHDPQAVNSIKAEESSNVRREDQTFQHEKQKIHAAAQERIDALLRDAKR